MDENWTDSSTNPADSENQEQNQHDPERNEIYSEVYEHKTPQGSIRSSRKGNGEQHHSAYVNEANLSDVVIEDTNPPRNESSPPPPLPVYAPGSNPMIASSSGAAKSKQPKSTKGLTKTNHKSFAIDYDNRDPENLQESIKVDFADIIAEPQGTHSFDTIWGSSYKVYSVTKFWLYRILTLILGIPCSLFWGIYFACLAFIGVWWIIPCIRAFSIKFQYFGKFWSLLIRTVLDPVFESIGLILSRIKVMMTTQRQD